jgi:D-lactate dehydrogenase
MPKNQLAIYFYGVVPEMKRRLRQKLPGLKLNISEKPFELDKLDPKTEILGIFVDSKVDKTVFDKLKKLKLIVTTSTGYDHIDTDEASKRKICVCNVPFYGENTVAQHAMCLILALSRQLFLSVKRVKEGVFDYHDLRGFDLFGKTIGVLGTGHIGIHLVDMLQGFGVKVIAYDAYPNKELENKHRFTYVSLNNLLAESDIISIHVPLLPTTYHLIGKKEIETMKKGVYIINTARGGIIDSEALVWGLETGKVAGAGLDVLEDENFIQDPEKLLAKISAKDTRMSLMDNILIDHANTIVTPHNAFNSIEALERIYDTTAENIKCFVANKPQNVVPKPSKK